MFFNFVLLFRSLRLEALPCLLPFIFTVTVILYVLFHHSNRSCLLFTILRTFLRSFLAALSSSFGKPLDLFVNVV